MLSSKDSRERLGVFPPNINGHPSSIFAHASVIAGRFIVGPEHLGRGEGGVYK